MRGGGGGGAAGRGAHSAGPPWAARRARRRARDTKCRCAPQRALCLCRGCHGRRVLRRAGRLCGHALVAARARVHHDRCAGAALPLARARARRARPAAPTPTPPAPCGMRAGVKPAPAKWRAGRARTQLTPPPPPPPPRAEMYEKRAPRAVALRPGAAPQLGGGHGPQARGARARAGRLNCRLLSPVPRRPRARRRPRAARARPAAAAARRSKLSWLLPRHTPEERARLLDSCLGQRLLALGDDAAV